MAEGYVKISRSIFNHFLWSVKPFSRGQAWVDLILLANHQDNEFLLGTNVETVERGALITSQSKLATRWGWSRCKVQSFLRTLEDASMVTQKADNKKTYLKLNQYSVWQDSETVKKQQKGSTQAAERQQQGTNKNVKNDKNVNNKELGERKFEFADSLAAYKGEYTVDMLANFCNYWSETTRDGKRMRWELEKTWDLELRLENWWRRQSNFSFREISTSTYVSSAPDIDTLLEQRRLEK